MAKVSTKTKPNKNAAPAGALIHKKTLGRRIAENWQYYILILPAIIYVAIWCYAPMYGLQIAFKNYKPRLGFWGSSWAGFKYFEKYFTGGMYSFMFKPYEYTGLTMKKGEYLDILEIAFYERGNIF